jgi:CHAT domain-containing protein
MNPSGILFGENSRLDIQGYFIGTTANAFQFGDRDLFSATRRSTRSAVLTLRDILELKLAESSGIRLAILSACETGLPGIV